MSTPDSNANAEPASAAPGAGAPASSATPRIACHVCGKEIGDRWFARIPAGVDKLHFCSPSCALLYASAPAPAGGNSLLPETRYRHYRELKHALYSADAFAGQSYPYDASLGAAR